jgi:cysteine desulfurase
MIAKRTLVYLDHAATTPTHPEVVAAMVPYLHHHYGNPSSVYRIARESREEVEASRAKVARSLGAEPEEIYFTSGGTESDNWAIKGAVLANRKKGNHIITSAIEHHAVLHTCEYLERQGFLVTYLPVDRFGRIDPAAVRDAITDQTTLISIMLANNEIGTIEPVAEIGKIARDRGVLFHTDAVQGIGHIPIDVHAMQVDLLSLSAHKFYGPKGVGALYLRNGVRIDNLLHGGAQERKRRAGTENLAGIVGLGTAIERVTADIAGSSQRLRHLRDRLFQGIQEKIPNVRINGHPEQRLPNNVNVGIEFVEGEAMLLHLDRLGICASTGSACTSGSLEPSHVLMAIGVPPDIAHGSLRFTLGEQNTEEEVEYVLDVLPDVVERLREMSPLYKPEPEVHHVQ